MTGHRSSFETLRGRQPRARLEVSAAQAGSALRYGGRTVDKKFYQDLLDQMSDGVYFVTVDRRITYWNGGAERITGYSAQEVLGHSCAEGILRHVNGAGRQLCLQGCPLVAVMEDGQPRQAKVYLHHKGGQRVPSWCGDRPYGTLRADRGLCSRRIRSARSPAWKRHWHTGCAAAPVQVTPQTMGH